MIGDGSRQRCGTKAEPDFPGLHFRLLLRRFKAGENALKIDASAV
jgi:hypothetical protein